MVATVVRMRSIRIIIVEVVTKAPDVRSRQELLQNGTRLHFRNAIVVVVVAVVSVLLLLLLKVPIVDIVQAFFSNRSGLQKLGPMLHDLLCRCGCRVDVVAIVVAVAIVVIEGKGSHLQGKLRQDHIGRVAGAVLV